MSSSIRPLIRSGITQCLRQQPRTTKWQCPRQFSTAPSRAYPSMTIDPRSGGMGKARHQPRASMKVEREKMTKQVGQMNTDKLVTRDLGLLPDTMVYPRGRNKPPFLRPRLRMLFKWAKQRLVDWFGYVNNSAISVFLFSTLWKGNHRHCTKQPTDHVHLHFTDANTDTRNSAHDQVDPK